MGHLGREKELKKLETLGADQTVKNNFLRALEIEETLQKLDETVETQSRWLQNHTDSIYRMSRMRESTKLEEAKEQILEWGKNRSALLEKMKNSKSALLSANKDDKVGQFIEKTLLIFAAIPAVATAVTAVTEAAKAANKEAAEAARAKAKRIQLQAAEHSNEAFRLKGTVVLLDADSDSDDED